MDMRNSAKEKEEVTQKSENEEVDIYKLFAHYNALYFDNELGACTISWTSRTASPAGISNYQKGACQIHLSEPLVKPCSSLDKKKTILHEMIHAYLWVKNDQKCRSNHGPSFQELMNKINSSSVPDNERPDAGYNITVSHSFWNDDSSRDNHKFGFVDQNHSSQGRHLRNFKGKDEADAATSSRSSRVSRRSASEVKAEENRNFLQIEKFFSVIGDPGKKFVSSSPPCTKDGDKRKEHIEPSQKGNKRRSHAGKKGRTTSGKSNHESTSHSIEEEEEDEEDPEPLVNKRTERRRLEKMFQLEKEGNFDGVQPLQCCRTAAGDKAKFLFDESVEVHGTNVGINRDQMAIVSDTSEIVNGSSHIEQRETTQAIVMFAGDHEGSSNLLACSGNSGDDAVIDVSDG